MPLGNFAVPKLFGEATLPRCSNPKPITDQE